MAIWSGCFHLKTIPSQPGAGLDWRIIPRHSEPAFDLRRFPDHPPRRPALCDAASGAACGFSSDAGDRLSHCSNSGRRLCRLRQLHRGQRSHYGDSAGAGDAWSQAWAPLWKQQGNLDQLINIEDELAWKMAMQIDPTLNLDEQTFLAASRDLRLDAFRKLYPRTGRAHRRRADRASE